MNQDTKEILSMWVIVALVCLWLLYLTSSMGCAGSPSAPSAPKSAPAAAAKALDAIHRADAKLVEQEKAIDATTPQNVEAQKPVLKTLNHGARSDLREGAESGKAAVKATAKDQQRIAELSEDDPVRSFLRWSAAACFGLAVLAFLAALFVPAQWKDECVFAGVVLLLGGAGFYAINAILKPLAWIVGGGIVVGVAMAGLYGGRWAVKRFRSRRK